MTTVSVKGERELIKSLDQFSKELLAYTDRVVAVTAFNVQKNATVSIAQEQSQGKPVKRGKRTHIQSKEGDAPNSDEGVLAGSIVVSHERGSAVAFVGTHLDYGAYLELILNRPWLTPAKQKEAKSFTSDVAKAVKKAIKKADKK